MRRSSSGDTSGKIGSSQAYTEPKVKVKVKIKVEEGSVWARTDSPRSRGDEKELPLEARKWQPELNRTAETDVAGDLCFRHIEPTLPKAYLVVTLPRGPPTAPTPNWYSISQENSFVKKKGTAVLPFSYSLFASTTVLLACVTRCEWESMASRYRM